MNESDYDSEIAMHTRLLAGSESSSAKGELQGGSSHAGRITCRGMFGDYAYCTFCCFRCPVCVRYREDAEVFKGEANLLRSVLVIMVLCFMLSSMAFIAFASTAYQMYPAAEEDPYWMMASNRNRSQGFKALQQQAMQRIESAFYFNHQDVYDDVLQGNITSNSSWNNGTLLEGG